MIPDQGALILFACMVVVFTCSFALTGCVFRLMWGGVIALMRRLRGSPSMLNPSLRHESAVLTAGAVAECSGDLLDTAMLTGWMEQAITDYCIRFSRAVEKAVDAGEIPVSRPALPSPLPLTADGESPYSIRVDTKALNGTAAR